MSLAIQSEITIRQQVVIPAALPANKNTFADLRADVESATTRDEIQIPDGEAWIVQDLFIAVAGDVPNADGDVYLTLEKARRVKMVTVGPLSTMLIGNQQRPMIDKRGYIYRAGEIMRIIGTNIAAPAAQRTNLFYMKVGKIFR